MSEHPRVLAVDDDPTLLQALRVTLGDHVELSTAADAESAIRLLRGEGQFSVVVSDMELPGMSGVDFLRAAREVAPGAIAMLLTGRADLHTAGRAVNEGHVFRFLTKPCPSEVLIAAVDDAVKEHQRLQRLKNALVSERARIVARLMETQQLALTGAVATRQRETVHRQIDALLTLIRDTTERAQAGTVVTPLNLRQIETMARRLSATLSLFDPCAAAAEAREVDLRVIVPLIAKRVCAMTAHESDLIRLSMPASPCVVWVEPVAFADALTHVLRNGVEAASDSAKPRVDVAVFEQLEVTGVIVRDNGGGVHPEISPHVFSAFFSTKGDDRPGLGLTLARRHVADLGGEISFTSEYPRGATFRIQLPSYRSHADTQPNT